MIAWIATSLRRLRDERLSAAGVAALVTLTAFVAAGTPRLLNRLADTTLQATVAAAAPSVRNIQFVQDGRPGEFVPDPFGPVDDFGQRLFDSLPPAVAGLISERGWTIDSGRWAITPATGDAATMRFRVQPDSAARLTLEHGAWPAAATTETPDLVSTELPTPTVTTFEVALSTETARLMQLRIGDVVTLDPDHSDPLVGSMPGQARGAIGARVVGLYRVNDPTDPWWLGDASLAIPAVRSPGGDARITDATALIAPAAYAGYLAATAPQMRIVRVTFREYVDSTRLRSDTVEGLLGDFKRLESTYPPTVRPFLQDTFGQTAMREGIRQLMVTYQARWASAVSVLTIGVIGPATVAIGALILVLGFAAQRRRSSLALARGRGASFAQIIVAVVAEGVLLAVPGAVLATLAAIVMIPAGTSVLGLLAGPAVAVVAIVLLVVAALPATGGPAFGPARESIRSLQPSGRRIVFEGLVVVLAVAAAILLRERGLRSAGSGHALVTADPLVAAAPALVGLAVGLITVRLFQFPMRFIAWLAHRRRDLVPLLAMRRATDGRRVGPTLAVLMVTVAIWAFSASVLVYLNRASQVAAWNDVGAAYRIQSRGGALPDAFDPTRIPGVRSSAAATVAQVNIGDRSLNVELIALDTTEYEAVMADAPVKVGLPVDLLAPTSDPIPIIVSQTVIDRPDGVKVGDEFFVGLSGGRYSFKVIGVVHDLPNLATGTQYAIVSRDQLLASNPNVPLRPNALFIDAPANAADAIAEAVAGAMPGGATIQSRAAETAAILDSPSTSVVAAGMTAAALVAFLYAALALAAGLALTGAAEAVEVAHLRTLGLSGRQVVGLVAVEHGPVVITALAVGLGLGQGLFVFLRQGLGLEAFIGSTVDVPITPDPGQLALVAAGIVGVLVLGLALGTLLQRSATPTAAVRRGFE